MFQRSSLTPLFTAVLWLVAIVITAVFLIDLIALHFWISEHGALALADKDSPLVILGGTTVALIALVVTGLGQAMQNLSNERSQNHRVLDLFLKFEDDHFRKVRSKAWEERSKWYRLPEPARTEFRKRLIGAVIPATLEDAIPACPEPGSSPKGKDESTFQAHPDASWSVYQMLNLYETLEFFECDNTRLSALGLYYQYWRGFLYEVIEAYEKAYNTELSEAEKKMFPRETWCEAFHALDKRFGLPPYNRKDDPLFRNLPEDKQDAQMPPAV